MKNKKKSNNGLGFVLALAAIFAALKLAGAIGWSWVWVLSPLWILAGIILVVSLGAALIILSGKAARQHTDGKRDRAYNEAIKARGEQYGLRRAKGETPADFSDRVHKVIELSGDRKGTIATLTKAILEAHPELAACTVQEQPESGRIYIIATRKDGRPLTVSERTEIMETARYYIDLTVRIRVKEGER